MYFRLFSLVIQEDEETDLLDVDLLFLSAAFRIKIVINFSVMNEYPGDQ